MNPTIVHVIKTAMPFRKKDNSNSLCALAITGIVTYISVENKEQVN
jgi:hypothetical protein